jgi:tetrahydromethanopterin S-methyltransferase subunit F/type II secretory pathway pseudopilin PulG
VIEMVVESSPVWLVMLLFLLIPVFFVVIVGLVVYAIVKNRPGIVAALGGGLLLLMLGGAAVGIFGYRSVAHVSNGSNMNWQIGPATLEAHYVSTPIGESRSYQPKFGISWIGLLLVIAFPLVLLFSFIRAASTGKPANKCCSVSGGGWVAAIAALAILGIVGLVGAKYFAARSYRVAQQSLVQREAAMREMALRQAQMQQKAAKLSAKMQQQAAEMDIHEAMDEFDKPRIPLPPAPSPPQPLAPNVVAVAEMRAGKVAGAEAELTSEAKAGVDAIANQGESEEKTASVDGKSAESEKVSDAKSKSEDERETNNKPAPRTTGEVPAPKSAAAPAAELAPAPRPRWVDEPPKRVGDIPREVIATDEYATPNECTWATDVYLLLKTYERLMELNGTPVFEDSLPSLTFNDGNVMTEGGIIISSDGGRTWNWNDTRIGLLKKLDIGVDFVRRELVASDGENPRQYFETNERSIGPMHKLYTQIEFTPSVDNDLRQRWQLLERGERLTAVGVYSGGILGLLGLVYGLLKVDTWTKGYYSKRLFLGVPAAIIGLGALLAFLVS